MNIATEAIDRLHSTAHSHHRIIVVEIMGHRTGWLTLGAGIAGGADVILLPEIPYDVTSIAEAIRNRVRKGKNFSIVAVAEGAISQAHAAALAEAETLREQATSKPDKQKAKQELAALKAQESEHTFHLAHELEELTGLEARGSILGHLQRVDSRVVAQGGDQVQALGRRHLAGNPAGECLCGFYCAGYIWRYGRVPWQCNRSRAARTGGR